LQYKQELARGRIPDFVPVFQILEKIEWFRQYSYIVRQNLVNTATVQIYKPGEKIFSRGEASPNLYLIVFGSVRATTSRGEAHSQVTVMLSTFFDGQIFGEMSDYELKPDQKAQISKRMQNEL